MKLFFILYSFYLLGLSIVPCADSNENNVNASSTAISLPQKHHHTTDICTPFCTCTCCASSAFYQPLTVFRLAELHIGVVKIATQKSLISHTSHSIWQPPKIA
jgi:hypothetical protein